MISLEKQEDFLKVLSTLRGTEHNMNVEDSFLGILLPSPQQNALTI
jgi:hypothetical protein